MVRRCVRESDERWAVHVGEAESKTSNLFALSNVPK
jgi:hypothetical protein